MELTDYEFTSEESSSDDSEVLDDINPWGGTTYSNGSRKYSSHSKKDRIQRKGRVPLNMTRNYGKKSGWGAREGVRELIQNLYVGFSTI